MDRKRRMRHKGRMKSLRKEERERGINEISVLNCEVNERKRKKSKEKKEDRERE